MSEKLFNYYNQELSYLRKQGECFAKAHPKIAGRLGMRQGGTDDPFVERMLESFAFLTARISQKNDEAVKTLTQAILDILYPHYTLGVPAASILQFHHNNQIDKPQHVARHTKLITHTSDNTPCFFRTIYPTTLWPFNISDIKLTNETDITARQIKSCLTIQLKTNNANTPITLTENNNLRFFINSASRFANLFYEYLFAHLDHISITTCSSPHIVELKKYMIKSVGFDDEENLLPYPPNSFSGYRLLSEYFAFPKKFMFFDITGLETSNIENTTDDLRILFFFNKRSEELKPIINKEFLKLSCSPIINLFEQQGEPFYLDNKQTEYHIIPNAQQAIESLEIYSIKDIKINSTDSVESINSEPYFSSRFDSADSNKQIYWHIIKRPTCDLISPSIPGKEAFAIFTDRNNNIPYSDKLVAIPRLLCTNRNLTDYLQLNNDQSHFEFWDNTIEGVEKMLCITEISTTQYRDTEYFSDATLISHIFANQISLTAPTNALEQLKNMLSLYIQDKQLCDAMLDNGLNKITTRPIIKRHPLGLKQGFCHGTEVRLVIDEKHFHNNESFLFGSLLEKFLSKTCSINSFIQLILISEQRGVIFKWEPRLGIKTTI